MAHNSDRNPAQLVNARVVDAAGNQASIVSVEHDGPDAKAWVKVAHGPKVLVPVSLLASQGEGMYRLPFTFQLQSASDESAQMRFPLMEEELHVDKRTVDTGRGVRLHKTVSEREQLIDQPLRRDELVVEHVPIGRVVPDTEVPQVRYEGDTMIVPVLEEVLVVQKQLLLKEEVRVTRQQQQVAMPRSVVLRSEQISVERFDEHPK